MSGETTPLDLDGIRGRAEAATDGPWFTDLGGNGDGHIFVGNRGDGRVYGLWEIVHASGDRLGDLKPVYRQQHIDDAEFMAHARTDVPALVAEVERLRANIEQARRYVEAARQRSMRGESSPVSELGFNVLAALGEESSS